jgi:hypothetical protein
MRPSMASACRLTMPKIVVFYACFGLAKLRLSPAERK